MSIVSVAIIISFHIQNQPTELELRMALPLGIFFWTLGVACLAVGFGNYIKTVTKYSRRMALVQAGWKTQVVRLISFSQITDTEGFKFFLALLIFSIRYSQLLLFQSLGYACYFYQRNLRGLEADCETAIWEWSL